METGETATVFLPQHIHQCLNCLNRKDPQYVFNSTILTIAITALGFLVAFAINQAVKETFERSVPKKDELSAMWAYAILATFGAIVLSFILMYNLNGTKW